MGIDWTKLGNNAVAVHCKTREEYYAFMKECEERGYTWSGGVKPTEDEMYTRAKNNAGEVTIAVYSRHKHLAYARKEHYVESGYTIYNYSVSEPCVSYRDNIVALMDRQKEKGIKKYGQILEQNDTLSKEQRIEHLQEELIDGLQYCEHLKQAMKDNLTANDYQRMAMRTASGMNYSMINGNGLLVNGVMGLNGEAGECIDIVKKMIFQGHELDREKLIEELGDVAWYLAVCCEGVGTTLEEVMLHNVEKLKKRYPDGFDKSRSINREEYTTKMCQNET